MATNANFLFVNKSAKSGFLSRSSGDERRKIYSHAQRIVSEPSRQHIDITWNVICAADVERGMSEIENVDNSTRKHNGSTETRHTKPQKHAQHRAKLTLVSRERNIAPAVDPYLEVSFSVHQEDRFLRHVYSTDIIPLLFPIPSLASTAGCFSLALAHEDQLVYHAFACLISTKVHKSSDKQCYKLIAAKSKHAALVHLQQLLSTKGNSKIAFSHCYAIGLMIWVEFLSGNYEDATAHNTGLNCLLSQACDVSVTPTYIVRIIHACSNLCAAMLDIAPSLLPFQAPHETELSQKAQACLASLNSSSNHVSGHAFLSPENLILLGPHLTRIAVDFQKVATLRETIHDANEPLEEMDVQYICSKEATIENDLQALQFETLDSMQHAIRVSLLVCSSIPFISAIGPSAALLRRLARNLRRYLQFENPHVSCEPNSELLLWVYMIGGFMAYKDDNWDWFKFQILGSMKRLNFTLYTQFEMMLRRFYYSKYLQKVTMCVWNEYSHSQ